MDKVLLVYQRRRLNMFEKIFEFQIVDAMLRNVVVNYK